MLNVVTVSAPICYLDLTSEDNILLNLEYYKKQKKVKSDDGGYMGHEISDTGE